MTIALSSFEEMETLEPEKREKLAYQAFYRAKQLNEFMFERIYKGVDDMDEDPGQFVVKPRNDEDGKITWKFVFIWNFIIFGGEFFIKK